MTFLFFKKLFPYYYGRVGFPFFFFFHLSVNDNFSYLPLRGLFEVDPDAIGNLEDVFLVGVLESMLIQHCLLRKRQIQ